ncbi:MAG: hypothetical protein R2769_02250 [Saprospiraceae bacterium]
MPARTVTSAFTEIKITLTQIKLNPANPISEDYHWDAHFQVQHMGTYCDDVANTVKILFYATQPLMEAICKKIEIAVLVERHKPFLVMVEYVGISLNKTLKEDIDVRGFSKRRMS